MTLSCHFWRYKIFYYDSVDIVYGVTLRTTLRGLCIRGPLNLLGAVAEVYRRTHAILTYVVMVWAEFDESPPCRDGCPACTNYTMRWRNGRRSMQ